MSMLEARNRARGAREPLTARQSPMIGIRLRQATVEQVDRLAAAAKATRSEIIRQIVEKALETHREASGIEQTDARDPLVGMTATELQDRFWNNIDKIAGSNGCWLWTGSMSSRGHGQVTLS